jgi:hypothetical protein
VADGKAAGMRYLASTIGALVVLVLAAALAVAAVRSFPPHNLVHIEPTTTTTTEAP